MCSTSALKHPGHLAPDLNRNTTLCLRVAPDADFAQKLPQKRIRLDHMIAAGQQLFQTCDLGTVDLLQILPGRHSETVLFGNLREFRPERIALRLPRLQALHEGGAGVISFEPIQQAFDCAFRWIDRDQIAIGGPLLPISLDRSFHAKHCDAQESEYG
ncbi:hypothetical protein [Phaeobacter gallaeciensis]|uniref:hypothetical protein n=1 Tax=Phaeobacter gallaeciensis TaxID=60890 RepID=UPI00237F0599|nr:hypothetical protein [Phaeobacter gallaeciensis]MDE4193476.1 hypothetical protein [Phaeobacter gallaeciensis]MDE4201723.1 hypothetical protein [Phaeobacter gallaeciensis]MDE4205923.1 hypothetical protein [Phaeobacter gallaeciensis]MDE4210046.1 hypothetical protein [Phaeobacter gallaeciensis]MDE4218414.1 hypothetical protein [Phaeobacter gallaeciensis]